MCGQGFVRGGGGWVDVGWGFAFLNQRARGSDCAVRCVRVPGGVLPPFAAQPQQSFGVASRSGHSMRACLCLAFSEPEPAETWGGALGETQCRFLTDLCFLLRAQPLPHPRSLLFLNQSLLRPLARLGDAYTHIFVDRNVRWPR